MQNKRESKRQGIVRSYLDFLDRSVFFKKPISCFFAVLSILIPLAFLFLMLQFKDLIFENTEILIACILKLAVLSLAGFFGTMIWVHRRINRDEGTKFYANLRRFIKTLGEWAGTLFAIKVFGFVTIIVFLLKDEYAQFLSMFPIPEIPFPVPLPGISFAVAIYGLICGIIIILATNVFLFFLDLLVWLIGSVWKLFARIVLYYYRCIVKLHKTIELNTSVWIGLVWLFSAAVVIAGLILCFRLAGENFGVYLIGIIPMALGLGLMAFLVIKRKDDKA